MSRYIHVCTSHGVGLPALNKAAAAEIFDSAAEAQLQKGRRRPQVTAVARYVATHQPALERRLAKALQAGARRLGAQAERLYRARGLAKDANYRDIIAEIIAELNFDELGMALNGELQTAILAAFKRAAALGATQVGLTLEDLTNQIDEAAVDYLLTHGGALIKDLAGTTATAMRAQLSVAVAEGMSTGELAKAIMQMGAFSAYRATMIARTELARAHVQGNVAGWKASGLDVKKRWILGDLHEIADECDDAAGAGVVAMDADFVPGVAFPPAHPNACFEGTSFAAYGQLRQMVSASYSGPAITLVAEITGHRVEASAWNAGKSPDDHRHESRGEHEPRAADLLLANRDRPPVPVAPRRVEITIGPNHPMLTGAGFVPARLVKEGDELIYDALADHARAARGEAHLKEVMLFEDAFDALRAVAGDTRVAGAAHYFHGDEAFVYGEVHAVRPERCLLPVLDASDVEHARERLLMGANADALLLALLGAPLPHSEALPLPTPGRVGSGDEGHALLARGRGVSRFHRCRVISSHVHAFVGRAFDASTLHGIYNAGGFVVKNCVCDILPILPPEDDDPEP